MIRFRIFNMCSKTYVESKKIRELKTARGHLMPQQQHLYNGLACPALYEKGLACESMLTKE